MQSRERLGQLLIIPCQAAKARSPGVTPFDVSTIMRSSRHCLSWSCDMTSLLMMLGDFRYGRYHCRLGALCVEPHLTTHLASGQGTALFEALQLCCIRPCDPPLALIMPAGLKP